MRDERTTRVMHLAWCMEASVMCRDHSDIKLYRHITVDCSVLTVNTQGRR